MDLSTLLVNEPDFRDFCDGILLMEVGPLVQLFRGAGSDGGVDAEFNGSFGGIDGHHVFQFKFAEASRADTAVRSGLLHRLKKEFQLPAVKSADCYILMTTAKATRPWVEKLRGAWSAAGTSGKLYVWDLGHLAQLASRHGFPGVSVSGRAREIAIAEVVRPTNDFLLQETRLDNFEAPTWPVRLVKEQVQAAEPVSFTGQSAIQDSRFSNRVHHLPQDATEHPLAHVCWSRFFPTAGVALTQVVRCRAELVAVTTGELERVAQTVRPLVATHAPHLSAEELDHTALGLAHGAACNAWSARQSIGILSESLELRGLTGPGSCPVLEGAWVPAFASDLLPLLQGLRDAGLPSALRRARDAYDRARADFLAEAWYPRNLGVDRPRITGP